jgi:N-acetylneuraminic acid mutarotase
MRKQKSRRRGTVIGTERLESRQLMCGGALGVYVNAGGPDYLDAGQNVWAADTGFTGGALSSTSAPIKGTAEQGLFDTAHVGSSFQFSADADSGGYTLTLMFAEPVMTKPGMRIFNVFAQGKQILKNFDLVAAAGPKTAITRSFRVNVTDNELDLNFQGVANDALVSAIELVPLAVPSAEPSGLSAAANSPTAVTVNWTDNANNETGFEIDRTVDGTNNWQNVGAAGVDGETFQDTSAQAGTTYDYRVQSFGQNGASPFTSPVIVRTPNAPPSAQALAALAASPASTDLRIDVGSTSNYKDSTGNVWMADTGASGGLQRLFTYPVANTSDPKLYDYFRSGNFSYALPADNGNYTLKLYFEDPVSTGKNQRLFDVTAEGQQVLTNFDIFAVAGYRKPAVESFPVTVSGNQLNLVFKSLRENAILAAIELVPAQAQTSAPVAPSGLSAVGTTGAVDLSWVDNSDNESGFEIDRKSGSSTFVKVATVPPNMTTYPDTGLTAGTTYTYEVRAINNVGDSAFTSPASATTTTATKPSSNFTKITWSKAANSPVARTEAETAVVNGKMYCFGGYTNSSLVPEAVADVYDPVSNTWKAITSMPTGETHAGTCSDSRYVYMAGGYTGPGGAGNQTFATTNVFRYDTVTNTWSNLPGLPQSRGAGGLVLLGDTLHFFGGTDIARKDRDEHWTLNLDDLSAGWQTAAPLPTVRNHMGAVVLDGKIYAVGGQQHQDAAEIAQSAVQVWDPANPNVWTNAASLPLARSHIAGATFVMDGRIIVLGGETTYLHSVDNDSAYDPSTNTWTALTSLPIPRSSGCANEINGVIFYMTGNISTACYKGIPG